ncbi:uncharacterized protein N7459_000416 [Penicillium hispanicum]|uniref:uncharacterized protein n=1 Tax=Penicillium hispanicum TaxID=1080232 RepID=UPI002540B4AC|nr:uncharacterized protein N7459_000416 [Penicillium hispanicum]KAJ5594208.1 hypothetical protein N7459_000416 [Penicillium hispanicum]
MALSARFSSNPSFSGTDPRERGKDYAQECERLLDWNNVSVTTIQACVLLGAIAITNGNSASENIYYAIACRVAQLLDLPNLQAPSRVHREVHIRSSFRNIDAMVLQLTIHPSLVVTLYDRCLVLHRRETA